MVSATSNQDPTNNVKINQKHEFTADIRIVPKIAPKEYQRIPKNDSNPQKLVVARELWGNVESS